MSCDCRGQKNAVPAQPSEPLARQSSVIGEELQNKIEENARLHKQVIYANAILLLKAYNVSNLWVLLLLYIIGNMCLLSLNIVGNHLIIIIIIHFW